MKQDRIERSQRGESDGCVPKQSKDGESDVQQTALGDYYFHGLTKGRGPSGLKTGLFHLHVSNNPTQGARVDNPSTPAFQRRYLHRGAFLYRAPPYV